MNARDQMKGRSMKYTIFPNRDSNCLDEPVGDLEIVSYRLYVTCCKNVCKIVCMYRHV